MRPPSRNLCFQRRGHGAALRARSLRPPGRRVRESRGEAALDVPRLAAEAVSPQPAWPSTTPAAPSTGEMSTFITESPILIEHSKSEEVKELSQMLRSMRWLHSFYRTSISWYLAERCPAYLGLEGPTICRSSFGSQHVCPCLITLAPHLSGSYKVS